MKITINTQSLLWVVGQRKPRLLHSYDRADYQRRLRRIAQLERSEMPSAWGEENEPYLFDALISAREELIAQSRAREVERCQLEIEAVTDKLHTAERRAAKDEQTAARKPEQRRLYELKANVRHAQVALYREELRIATTRLQRLDDTTEVALLWVR